MRTTQLIFSFLLVAAISLQVSAQRYLGFANSNYSGVHGMLLQPASIVDMPLIVDINLVSTHFTATNNYVKFRVAKMAADGEIIGDFQDNYTFIDTARNNKFVFANIDVMGPSCAFTFGGGKNAIGIHSRFRTIFNFDNVDVDLARLAWEGLDFTPLWEKNLNNEQFSMQYMSWMEYGATYGREVIEINHHYLKAAVTMKLIQGLGSAYLYVNDLSYNFTNSDTLSLFQSQVDYGHSSNFEFNTDGLKYKFIANPTIGFDMGFVYEWRKDPEGYMYEMDGKTDNIRQDIKRYRLKVGLSILDIGRVKFTKGGLSGNFVADIDDYYIGDFNVGSVEDFNDTIAAHFVFTQDSGSTYTMNLPTAISLQVDYNIWKGFYVNFTSYNSFRRKNNDSKVRQQSQFSITPRYEHKWFDFGLPLSVNTDKQWQLGMSMRLAVLFFGTNDFIGLFKDDVYGADFYFGLKIPIARHIPRDKDHDLVSNRKDECKRDPGFWETLGCPDSDKDGLTDNLDDCPNEAGPKENNGCPWPDKDGDGIVDKDDKCPDEPGPEENMGCPWGDQDGDGITDNIDGCPKEAGPEENNGCPWLDSDRDGLTDNIDKCPDTPGPKENEGCPYGDRDGDGITDDKDQCPDVAGPADNAGCPWGDLDGDGVTDNLDRCPKTPGPAENEGCPVLEKEQEEVIQTAFDNLEFETASAIIKSSSYEYLYKLADLLDKNPTFKLRIAGHTDNVGNDEYNLKLSKSRAEAVAKVFLDRGIDKSRLVIEYYGESKPIATNDTPEGRAQNRRVEMEIVFD